MKTNRSHGLYVAPARKWIASDKPAPGPGRNIAALAFLVFMMTLIIYPYL